MQFPAVAFILLLISLSANAESKVELNREFELKFHETTVIQKDQITVRFQSLLQDSRCPKGDQCTTQGNASIELQLSKEKEKPESIELNTDSVGNEITYQKYKIKLISLNPEPVSGKETDSNQYVATILITTP